MSVSASIGQHHIARFCGPLHAGEDRQRWEISTAAQGMTRTEVLALISHLALDVAAHPAPDFSADLKFANDTAELLLDRLKGYSA